MDLIEIGKFIAELRKESGLTQEEFGEKLGVTNKTVSRWETGTYLPPADILLQIGDMFHITVNEILSGKRLPESEYREAAEENIIQTVQMQADKKKDVQKKIITGVVSVVAIVALILLMQAIKNYGIELIKEFKGVSLKLVYPMLFKPLVLCIIGLIIAYNTKLYSKFKGEKVIFWIVTVITIIMYAMALVLGFPYLLSFMGVTDTNLITPLFFNINVLQFMVEIAPFFYLPLGILIGLFWTREKKNTKIENY